MGDGGNNIVSRVFGTISEAEKKVKEELDPKKNGLGRGIGAVSSSLIDLMQTITGVISPFAKVQSAAAALATSVGLAGKSIMSNSIRLIEQNKKMQLSASYGISNEEMMNLQKSVMSSLGRNVQIDQVGTATPENPNFDSSFENLIAASQVFGQENVAKIVAGYDKLGISMKSAAKATGKLYKEAGEYGINLQKYTQNFTENLHMAQMYNFRNGVNGLKEMARKATEIRQDMKQIANFADKVGSVTGAVETAASLQVLGGSFAALANPLTMLNKSLTDINGLQDMAIGMTEGTASYNPTTHQIEMDPATRQIMKRAAESMGMDPGALIDQAYAQARRAEVTKQMTGLGGLSSEMEKLLSNVAEIDSETGVAGATIDGEFKSLAEIAASPELQEQLIEETRSESEDIKVIAKSVMGIEKIVAGKTGQIENESARNAIRPGVVGGKSSYDLALETVTKRLDSEIITAAANLDQAASNIIQNLTTFTASTYGEILKPFNSSTPEEFATKMGESFANILGERARGTGEKLGGGLAGIVESLNEKLQPYGVNITAPFSSTEYGGRAGRTTPLGTPEGGQVVGSSVAFAANDVKLEATNFSLNGEHGIQFTPLTGTGEMSRAAATLQGDGNSIDVLTQTLADMAAGLTATMLVTPTNGNGRQTPEIKGTDSSVPSVTVAPTGDKTTQTQQPGQNGSETRQTTNNTPVDIKLTGTFTFVGDNGKIGVVDIMKMLDDSPTFKQALAKALADTYARMDKSGLVSN